MRLFVVCASIAVVDLRCCNFFSVVFDLLVNYQVSSLFISYISRTYGIAMYEITSSEKKQTSCTEHRWEWRIKEGSIYQKYHYNTPNKGTKLNNQTLKKGEAKKRDCLDEKSGFSSPSFAAAAVALYFCFFALLPYLLDCQCCCFYFLISFGVLFLFGNFFAAANLCILWYCHPLRVHSLWHWIIIVFNKNWFRITALFHSWIIKINDRISFFEMHRWRKTMTIYCWKCLTHRQISVDAFWSFDTWIIVKWAMWRTLRHINFCNFSIQRPKKTGFGWMVWWWAQTVEPSTNWTYFTILTNTKNWLGNVEVFKLKVCLAKISLLANVF